MEASRVLTIQFLIKFITIVMMISLPQCASIGVNWGTRMTNPLPPKKVVKMLKSNKFDKVKFFDCDPANLDPLAGTGMEVTVAIPNTMLDVMSNDRAAAVKWVAANVTTYLQKSVNIRLVAVGNEPFLPSYNNKYTNSILPALQHVQEALDLAGHGDTVKVTVPLNSDVYNSPPSNPVPSAGDFRPDIREQVLEILQFLNEIKAPITINIYPYLSLYVDPNFPIGYAFFDGSQDGAFYDGELYYSNVFDASYDTLVSALSKNGFPDMEIVVGEIGWPTDGDRHATVENAKRFNQGLLHHVLNGQGTPLRRGVNINVFLFSLVDEDAKSTLPGNFERHWGLYRFDGTPKFELDLTGSQRDVELHPVKGVKHLPKRWCVLSPNTTGLDYLRPTTMEYACENADCTALGYGCSCNQLSADGNLSYAMNMIYQAKRQADDACDFHGLSMITNKDPSVGGCEFPIMISSSSWVSRMNIFLTLFCFTFLFNFFV